MYIKQVIKFRDTAYRNISKNHKRNKYSQYCKL